MSYRVHILPKFVLNENIPLELYFLKNISLTFAGADGAVRKARAVSPNDSRLRAIRETITIVAASAKSGTCGWTTSQRTYIGTSPQWMTLQVKPGMLAESSVQYAIFAI